MSPIKAIAAFLLLTLMAASGAVAQDAAAPPQRLALVVGQGGYEKGKLATAANDAGLIAQTLTSAGFEVIQGRDLNANDLRRLVRDFLDKAQELKPGSAIMVYLSGYGIQLEGENYLIPVDARIERDADVPIEGFRLSDLVRSIERTPATARIVVADMARDYPLTGAALAKGLAVMDAPKGFLVAYSSAPNIVAPDGQGPYGAYATALAEMIRQPGLPLTDVFSRARLRTHEATKGVQTPWESANLEGANFVFFEQAEAAAAASAAPAPAPQARRIEEVSPEEAYAIAVERDTIQGYQAFLRRYPDHALAKRVNALLAARREALFWRRTVSRNTSEAYWTYLRHYPNGTHAEESRRRLARLSAPVAPPLVFEEVIYEDIPPPLPVIERIEVVEVITIIREAPPPPPLPGYLLPPLDYDEEFITIIRQPPPPPPMIGILPIPVAIPVPVRARPPAMFYQPIAPVTPRGVVAIPVATPPILGSMMGGPGAPRPVRAPRPRQPVIEGQPGLADQIRPLPVAVRPDVRPAPRPGERPALRPVRLPSQPIPLPADGAGADQPQLRPTPDAPRPAVEAPRPARPGLVGPRPELPGDRRGPSALRPSPEDRPRPGPAVTVRPRQEVILPREENEPRPVLRPERPGIGPRPLPLEGPRRVEPDRRRPVMLDPPERMVRPGRPLPGEGTEFAPRPGRPVLDERPVSREERIRPVQRIAPIERPEPLRPVRPTPRDDAPARIREPGRIMPGPSVQPRGISDEMIERPRPNMERRPRNDDDRGCRPTPGRPCPR